MDLKLHPKQGIAFQSDATEILYGGAAGGGKSHLLRVAAISWCHAYQGLQVYLFRRTFDDLYKNHMEGPTGFPSLLDEWQASGYARINHGKNFIQIGARSKIHLCHCQHERDVFKYQGAEMHVLLVDELTHFKASMYRYLRSRVRLGAMVVKDTVRHCFPRILCASNPGNIGHSWVKSSWINADPSSTLKIWQAPKSEGGMRRQFVPARLDDNPTMDAERHDYEAKLEGIGNPQLVKAMLAGDWDIVAGGMVDDVWDRAVHCIEPFVIPKGWILDRAFDWGSSKPFALGWWAESDGTKAPNGKVYPKGTLFLIAQWYGWSGKENEGLRMLAVEVARKGLEMEKALTKTYGINVQAGPADPSIFASENGVCIANDMALVGMRFQAADAGPGSRINGAERVRQFLKASMTYPLEEPGLFVFSTCAQWLRTVPVIPRDLKKPDDVDTESEDHDWDMTRYRVSHKRSTVSAVKLTGV